MSDKNCGSQDCSHMIPPQSLDLMWVCQRCGDKQYASNAEEDRALSRPAPVAEPPGQRGMWPACAPGPWSKDDSAGSVAMRVLRDSNGVVIARLSGGVTPSSDKLADFILSRVNAPAVPPGRAVEPFYDELNRRCHDRENEDRARRADEIVARRTARVVPDAIAEARELVIVLERSRPGPMEDRFVEVEDGHGKSIKPDRVEQHGAHYHLVFRAALAGAPANAIAEAERRVVEDDQA